MRINLTDVQDRSFEALPAGKYVVKITDWEMRETKDNPGNKLPAGTPMVNWEFTVLREAGGDTKYENRKLWMNSILHEKTLFNLKALLRATGNFSDGDLEGEIDFEPAEQVGAEMIAVVTQREYNGDTTNDVKRVMGLSTQDREGAASLLP
jgi:hypothetical protein